MWLVTKFISPTPPFSCISSSEHEAATGNWIDRLENWRSLCSDLAKPKLWASLKSLFSFWVVFREVFQTKTCASHWSPASLRVCGATRVFQTEGCDKIRDRMPRAECGPELRQEKGQDSNGGGTSVRGRQMVPTVAAASWVSCSKPDCCTLPLRAE